MAVGHAMTYQHDHAVDKDGRPRPVLPVLPQTKEEVRRYNEAGRRQARLAQRYKKTVG